MRQSEIAKKLGVTRAMVCTVFKGRARFSWEKAKRLAEILSIPVVTIMDGDTEAIIGAAEKLQDNPATKE